MWIDPPVEADLISDVQEGHFCNSEVIGKERRVRRPEKKGKIPGCCIFLIPCWFSVIIFGLVYTPKFLETRFGKACPPQMLCLYSSKYRNNTNLSCLHYLDIALLCKVIL